MSARKGGSLHAKAGTAFFLSMLAMAGTGSIIALLMPERGTATVGVLTCYLVATSWMAARRRDAAAGRLEAAGLLVALACAAAFLIIGWLCLQEPDGKLDRMPAAIHFPFAALALLGAALDLNFILKRRLSNPQRVARHLWRMGTAFLIAAFSFFIGQQANMPEFVQGSPLLFAPPLAVLATMLFWIFRVRLGRRFGRWPRRDGQPVPPRLAQEVA
jgi:cytochrome bd-type quinol oxidase subunit 2